MYHTSFSVCNYNTTADKTIYYVVSILIIFAVLLHICGKFGPYKEMANIHMDLGIIWFPFLTLYPAISYMINILTWCCAVDQELEYPKADQASETTRFLSLSLSCLCLTHSPHREGWERRVEPLMSLPKNFASKSYFTLNTYVQLHLPISHNIYWGQSGCWEWGGID